MTDGDTPTPEETPVHDDAVTSDQSGNARPANSGPDIGGSLTLAWQYFVEDIVAWLVMGLIVVGIQLLLSSIPFSGLVVLGPLTGGLCYAAFMRMRGTPASVGMLFSPMQTDLVPLILVGLVVGLATTIAGALCLIPLFFVYPLLMFAIPLVVERKLPFMDAISLSISTVREQYTQWILFCLVNLGVMIAGVLLAGVGMIVTIPLATLMIVVEYRETFGLQSA